MRGIYANSLDSRTKSNQECPGCPGMLQRWASQQVGLRNRRNHLLQMIEEANGRNAHVEFQPSGENYIEIVQT